MDFVCTCGSSEPHKIARRTAADGTPVELWSDGAVTGRMGFALPGVPVARPRTAEGAALALRAGWLFVDEAEIYEASEFAALYAACRTVAKRGGLPGDVRTLLAEDARPVLRPAWEVLTADRDGRPTTRVWRLPRLRWPGLVVWDNTSQARGGRYEIMSIDHDDVCMPTGVRFATLADLFDHLAEVE